jgi:predicted RND superfamily exporter protein
VVLCSLTTLLGYLALTRSLNYGVRSLGITAVIGEAACLVAAAMWLPAALVWLRRQRRAPETVPTTGEAATG